MYNRLLQHKVRTALVYCDTKSLSPGTGAASHIFRLNSINDPDYTGVGHQPAFHDKWATLYGNYKVVRTSWAITFTPKRVATAVNFAAGGTAAGETHPVADTSHHDQLHLPGILAYEVSDDTTAKQIVAADKNIIREASRGKRNVKWRMTSADPKRAYLMTGSMTPGQYLDNYSQQESNAAMGSDPTNVGYLHVGCLSKDGNSMADYRFDIRITYVVELTDPVSVEEEN